MEDRKICNDTLYITTFYIYYEWWVAVLNRRLILLPFFHVTRTFHWYLSWFSSLFLRCLRQRWSISLGHHTFLPMFDHYYTFLTLWSESCRLSFELDALISQTLFRFWMYASFHFKKVVFLLCTKRKLYCPVYAKQCFKGFYLTKGNTCGNLRPIQSLNWKFTKGK